MKAAFVYPNPRGALQKGVGHGTAPDTNLLGQNHLAEHGIESWVHESVLSRSTPTNPALHRLTWYGRELALPFELRAADVICTPLATFLPLVARAARKPRVVVISYHLGTAYARAGDARRRLQRAAARAADHVVCISQEGARLVVEDVGVPREHVTTATLGVDERYWLPMAPAPDGYVLTVGRDLARDYRTFAAALEKLPVRGIVVAKEENLRGVHLPGNVEVRLNVSPQEVRQLYAGAACVVVPVQDERRALGTENSGTIALLEAMAAARATVVTERRFLADYIDDGRTSLTAPAEDARALSAQIRVLLEDPDRAARMGAEARARVVAQHTTRLFAKDLAGVLNRVCDQPTN